MENVVENIGFVTDTTFVTRSVRYFKFVFCVLNITSTFICL